MQFLTSLAGTFARVALAVGCLVSIAAPGARAQTWIGPGGTGDTGNWGVATNWNPATIPNAVGASAIFNDAPSARTVTVQPATGTASYTVGSLTFNVGSANANVLTVTTGNSLVFDNGGAGVQWNFNGTTGSLANTTISGTTTTFYVFNDNVTANVNYIANSTSGITTQGCSTGPGLPVVLGALPKPDPA